jgi:hypothetical protein
LRRFWLSFAFYIPVPLCAHRVPAVGALTLPKACAYVWLLVMGYLASAAH